MYYWNTTNPWVDYKPNFSSLSFPTGVISFTSEPTLNEGIASLIDGNIFYFNLPNLYKSSLVGTVDQNVGYSIK